MLEHGSTIERDGRRFVVAVVTDDDIEPPWEREDGHGPVSTWRRRGYWGWRKTPGERLLDSDRNLALFYDFAEACRTARRDGWGWLPGPLQVKRTVAGWAAWVDCPAGLYAAARDDVNEAIRAVYAAHRATMTPRQYAAGAAEADFQRLRAWCANDWCYVGVMLIDVTTVEDFDPRFDGDRLADDVAYGRREAPVVASLWGIESDDWRYIDEVANELIDEVMEGEDE